MKFALKILIFWAVFIQLGALAFCDVKTNQLSKEASEAYKKGDYDLCIQSYESILEKKITSGHLYYNLGNCYFKKSNYPKAILNYERAKILMPRNKDVSYNLDYVKSKNGLLENKQPQGIESLAESMNFNEIFLIVSLLLAVLGYSFLISLFMNWPKKVKNLILIFSVCVLVLGSIFLNKRAYLEHAYGIVLMEESVKFEPTQDATIYFTITPGMKIKLKEEDDDWIKIESDNKSGWIKKTAVEKI